MIIKLQIIFLLIIFPFLLRAADPLFVSGEDENIQLGFPNQEIFIDSSNQLTINEILSNDFSDKFALSKTSIIPINNPEVTYWVRFSIFGKGLLNEQWLIESSDLHQEYIAGYYTIGDTIALLDDTGFNQEFETRDYFHKNFLFKVPEVRDSREVITFYFRISASNNPVSIIRLRSARYQIFYSINEYYLLGVFYGILSIMAVYNLLLFFSMKEKFYLYFVFYILSCGLLGFSEDGIGFQYIWNKWPWFNHVIGNYGAPFIFLVFFTIYAKSFLDLQKLLPKLNFLINVFVGIYSVIYVFSEIYHFEAPFFYLIPFILIYLGSVQTWRMGHRSSRFFVIGYSFTLLGVISLILRRYGLTVSDNILFVYSLDIGFVIEIVLFSLAQADRFKMVKNEKELAQQKTIEQLKENERIKDRINKEIEQKVIERTLEIEENKKTIELKNQALNEINDKLKNQTIELQQKKAEIEKINSNLNDENLTLHGNLNDLLKARVMMSNVSFEEFEKIFPDDEACYKYLDELKWPNQYRCKKCGNEKYIRGTGNYSRRCTKCRYNESCTTNTIFQRSHLPMKKAFYLLFLVYVNGEEITASELSNILELRQNTCWKFKGKILERINKIKKENHIGEVDGWGKIIKL
ncbi:7TM diverse intracellular signaling domain-containing protein [Flexithrix dorotheae]|uniref:7TM diverse intracellular signaling domain-containing protein n=1 Tax=Flexithrix dorotheae TaxID=70993 RepID=UPI00036D8E83|nr:7TM diverse intracellular signaling domain-containing protein [Flexithrix dorotheae]